MCNKQKVYRITLRSDHKISGNENDGRYMIRLPYTVNNGYIHVESFSIIGNGSLTTGLTTLRICSSSLPQKGHFYSGDGSATNGNLNIIEEIPAQSNYANASDDFCFRKKVNSNSIGLPLVNFDFNNIIMDLRLLNQDNELLDEADIVDFTITFLIVDNEPNFLEY